MHFDLENKISLYGLENAWGVELVIGQVMMRLRNGDRQLAFVLIDFAIAVRINDGAPTPDRLFFRQAWPGERTQSKTFGVNAKEGIRPPAELTYAL